MYCFLRGDFVFNVKRKEDASDCKITIFLSFSKEKRTKKRLQEDFGGNYLIRDDFLCPTRLFRYVQKASGAECCTSIFILKYRTRWNFRLTDVFLPRQCVSQKG